MKQQIICSRGRREYIPVGLSAASMPQAPLEQTIRYFIRIVLRSDLGESER